MSCCILIHSSCLTISKTFYHRCKSEKIVIFLNKFLLHFRSCFSTPFFYDFHTSSYSYSFSFWILLQHPDHSKCSTKCMRGNRREEEEERRILDSTALQPSLSFNQKIRLIPSLLKYMVPVGLVYVAEYIINQGLVSLWLLFIP